MSSSTDIKKLFRKSFFGGFNKKDVEEYIKSLEDELEKKQSESTGGLSESDKSLIDESINEIKNLKNEREELENRIKELTSRLEEKEQNVSEQASDEENAKLILKLLSENKRMKQELQDREDVDLQLEQEREAIKKVLSDAQEQAKTLVLNAEKAAEEKRKRADQELKNELENRVIDFITINYRLKDFTSGIDKICEQLQGVSLSLKTISQEVPAKVIDLVEESEQAIIDTPENMLKPEADE